MCLDQPRAGAEGAGPRHRQRRPRAPRRDRPRLAYRLYTLCERKKRAAEALSYNALVQSFSEITRVAREGGKGRAEQGELFDEPELDRNTGIQ